MISRKLSLRDLQDAITYLQFQGVGHSSEDAMKMRDKYLKLYRIMQLRDKTDRSEDIIVRLTK